MRVVFVGAGNLATNLALEFKKNNFTIEQIYSHTIKSATLLAGLVNCEATNDVAEIIPDADLYIFSVKDNVLSGLLKQIPANNGIWIHTAGSVPVDVFEGHVRNYGVVYPLQTFSKTRRVDFKVIPLFMEASAPGILKKLKSIFSVVSNVQIDLSSEKRKYLHLTAVFACNFVNRMYAVSEEILKKEDIPFEVMLPLIDETAAKIHVMSPGTAQTGPAIRFDKDIINRHLSMLDNDRLKVIYQLISEDIHGTNKHKI